MAELTDAQLASEAFYENVLEAVASRLGVDTRSPIAAILAPLIRIATAETLRWIHEDGGMCCYDWHRNEFDGAGDYCSYCDRPRAEHESILACPGEEISDDLE